MVKPHLKIELYNTDSGFSNYGASHLNIEGKISVIEGYFSRDVDDPTFMNLKTEYNLTAGDKFYFLPGAKVDGNTPAHAVSLNAEMVGRPERIFPKPRCPDCYAYQFAKNAEPTATAHENWKEGQVVVR